MRPLCVCYLNKHKYGIHSIKIKSTQIASVERNTKFHFLRSSFHLDVVSDKNRDTNTGLTKISHRL